MLNAVKLIVISVTRENGGCVLGRREAISKKRGDFGRINSMFNQGLKEKKA